MDDPPEIQIHNPQRYGGVEARSLRRWLGELVRELAPEHRGLGVLVTSDGALRDLNGRYRDQDRPTDVLSFPGQEDYLGDIAISMPTARRQGRERGHDTARELRLLCLHGVLHCLGYDHEVDDGQMEALEEDLRARWLDRAPGGREASA